MMESDRMVETTCYAGNSYGISKDEIDRIQQLKRIPIYILDVKGKEKLEKTARCMGL